MPLPDNERRRAARGLILAINLEDESLLAQMADEWTSSNLPWVKQVKWGQWEGLRQRGEYARTWTEYKEAAQDWFSEGGDKWRPDSGQSRPARRAWDLEPLRGGTPRLRESLMGAIELASRPTGPGGAKTLKQFLEERGFTEPEIVEIDQLRRARRARRFVELLVLCVRLKKEEAKQWLASIV